MNSLQDPSHSYRRLLKDSLFEHPFGNRERSVTICATSLMAAVFVFSLFISLFTCFRRRLNPSPSSKPPTSTCSSDLTTMPVYIYGDVSSSNLSSNSFTSSFESKNCVICLAEFEHGDEVRVLPKCKHAFHKGCIDQWLPLRSLLCPLCRDRTEEDIGAMRRSDCTNDRSRIPAFILAFGLGSNIPLPSHL